MRALVLMLMLAGQVPATDPITRLAQLPAIDQQKEDFFGALATAGKSIKAVWMLPETLNTSNDSPLTLTLSNVLNPDDLRPLDLDRLPEFQTEFSRIESPSRMVCDPETNTVQITTMVRARKAGPLKIPELKFVYYLPQAKRFQTTYAESMTRTVAAEVAPPALPLDGPPSFFVERTATRNSNVPAWLWWAIPLALATATVGFVAWHRWKYPHSAERARILRIGAVRVAMRELGRLPEEAPADVLTGIWQRYLVSRYGVRPTANTPQELAEELTRLQFPQHRTEQAKVMIEQLNAAQFSPSAKLVLARQLKELIESWEGLSA